VVALARSQQPFANFLETGVPTSDVDSFMDRVAMFGETGHVTSPPTGRPEA
jgi:hypothetical protein